VPEAGVIASNTINLPFGNIDTDQIYPGRYLTTTTSEGLGELCFYDWRHDPAAGKQSYFENFDPDSQKVLVGGENFGCGSSREHAVWALLNMGFCAVVSTRFADIFKSNAEKNGLLLVTVEKHALDFLLAHNHHKVTINIADKTLLIPEFGTISFILDGFTSYCLLNGVDAMGYLNSLSDMIDAFEKTRNQQLFPK